MAQFGLAGYGLWGKHHARAIAASADSALAAIACASEATAAIARADYPELPVVLGYEALLGIPGLSAIDIVTPNDLHAPIALAALDAGLDVLLEKPMALTVDECDRIITAEHRSGRTVSILHQFRLSTQWGRIKTMIDAGEIGEPRYANISLYRFPYRPGSGGWRNRRDRVGSWILEEPVHFFDTVMWYFESLGDPLCVSSAGNSIRPASGMNENFSCVLRWQSGAYATITQTLSGFENHQLVEVTGSEGSVRAWWSGASDRTRNPTFELKRKQRSSDVAEILDIGPSGEVFELAEAFSRTGGAFKRRRPLVSAAEARKRIIVCLAAEQALGSGKEHSLVF